MIEIKALASSSAGNCYHVTDGKTPFLIECGIPFTQIRRALNFTVTGLAGCLVSHSHLDHAKAAADLMKAGVDVYLSRGTADALKLTSHRAHIIRALQQIQIGSWTILPFEAEHDAAEPLGFLLANQSGDKLLYATDTYYIRYRFKGLTHLMIECNYAADILQANVDKGALPPTMKRRIMRSHLSLEKLKGFLRANNLSKVKEIRLIHLSDGNSDAVRFKREIQELTGKPVIIEDKKAGL